MSNGICSLEINDMKQSTRAGHPRQGHIYNTAQASTHDGLVLRSLAMTYLHGARRRRKLAIGHGRRRRKSTRRRRGPTKSTPQDVRTGAGFGLGAIATLVLVLRRNRRRGGNGEKRRATKSKLRAWPRPARLGNRSRAAQVHRPGTGHAWHAHLMRRWRQQ